MNVAPERYAHYQRKVRDHDDLECESGHPSVSDKDEHSCGTDDSFGTDKSLKDASRLFHMTEGPDGERVATYEEHGYGKAAEKRMALIGTAEAAVQDEHAEITE